MRTPADKLEQTLNEDAAVRMADKIIGDVNSNEAGSGARYNQGKTKLEYIPMHILMDRTKAINGKLIGLTYNLACYIAEFEEGNDDAIKSLLAMIDMEETCLVLDFGAKKYAAWNWAKGMDWSVVIACFKRHWIALANGEETDPESGLPHMGHLGCNVVFLAHYVKYYPAGDDRPDPSIFKVVELDLTTPS